MVGGTIFWVNVNGLNQNMIQRYLALKDVKSARRGLWTYTIGVIIMIGLCMYNGLLIHAYYFDCDPLTTKLAKAKDQLLPLLVMDILKDLPGLPGLFIAGVFSAALSSLSTGLNSMAAVVLEDFYKPYAKRPLTEKETGYLMRGTVCLLGSIGVALVYVVQHLGAVLQLSMSISAATLGPLLGIYTMGLFVPWVNSKGVLIGACSSLTAMSILSFQSQVEIAMDTLQYNTKPLSVEGCEYNFASLLNATTSSSLAPPMNEEFHLHRISYLYYTGFGAIITVSIHHRNDSISINSAFPRRLSSD